jgi:Ni/Co efflux regulator RcnB
LGKSKVRLSKDQVAMKKFVTTAIAAAIAAGSLGLASAASAQSYGRPDQRQEQRQDHRRIRTVAMTARTP